MHVSSVFLFSGRRGHAMLALELGVQACALPIAGRHARRRARPAPPCATGKGGEFQALRCGAAPSRSHACRIIGLCVRAWAAHPGHLRDRRQCSLDNRTKMLLLILSLTPGMSDRDRTEENPSELQSLIPTSHADFCLKQKKHTNK